MRRALRCLRSETSSSSGPGSSLQSWRIPDEDGQLGIANGELTAVLDFHVFHRVAIGQDSVFRLGPLDNIDELLGKETHTLVPKYTAESPGLFQGLVAGGW